MHVVTTRCRQYGHPEFHLEADGPAADLFLAEWSQGLEEMVANGSQFLPGQSFQVGWMVTQVMQYDERHLTLHEPDMQSMPFRWVRGVSQTLHTMMVQNFTLESVGLLDHLDLPSAWDFMTVCDRFSGHGFFMVRGDPQQPNDSGWFLGCLDPRHDHRNPRNIGPISVYEAYLNQRFIVGFLGFPAGSMAVADPRSGLRLMLDDQPLQIASGSYLDRTLRGQ